MAVITVSRQMGSLGTEIGRDLAKQLNYDYADKERIGQMLMGYGLPEPEVDKFDEKKPPFWDSFSLQRRKFLHLTQAVIYDLSSKGRVVIVGRGGQVLLKDVPGTLHVRITAPFDVRVRRLIETQGWDEKHATRFLRQSDRDSSGYIQTFFNVNWDDPNLYDLTLNSQKLALETAIKLIIDSAHSPEIQGKEEQAQEKLADLALVQKAEARLVDLLGIDLRHVEVGMEKGIVFLKGTVVSTQIRENCEEVVSTLEGIKRVENLLAVSQYYRFGL